MLVKPICSSIPRRFGRLKVTNILKVSNVFMLLGKQSKTMKIKAQLYSNTSKWLLHIYQSSRPDIPVQLHFLEPYLPLSVHCSAGDIVFCKLQYTNVNVLFLSRFFFSTTGQTENEVSTFANT